MSLFLLLIMDRDNAVGIANRFGLNGLGIELGAHPCSSTTGIPEVKRPGSGIDHPSIAGVTRGADKSLARPTSRCILFDGENISFDSSLVIYI